MAEAGQYLKKQSPTDTVVITARYGPIIGYYADRSYLFLYTRDYSENIEILQHAEYFVLDRTEFWRQSAEETQQLLHYVEEDFIIERVIGGEANPITIYHRLATSSVAN
jgi:hypothetical protein